MLATVVAGAGHPAVAALLGVGSAGLAAGVVAMAWSVHAAQIRLAEQLARRQFIVTGEDDVAARAVQNGHGTQEAAGPEDEEALGAGPAPPVIIEGPDTVLTGEQARYRVRPSGSRKVVSWAAGGGAVAQYPDPAHPDELLLIADQPGTLALTARVRDGLMERRGTKSVTAVEDVTDVPPPFTLRLFLHGWGLIVVGVLAVGFAGALVALGSLSASGFIALVAPMAALLAVVAVAWGSPSRPAALIRAAATIRLPSPVRPGPRPGPGPDPGGSAGPPIPPARLALRSVGGGPNDRYTTSTWLRCGKPARARRNRARPR